MESRRVDSSEEYLARFEKGADWREEIENLARTKEITAGWFTALGAVQDAEIWFYDQSDQEYQSVIFDEPLEVASCVGNVSILDDDVFAHTHAVLSREDGETLAGHLNGGTVFAGEIYLKAFDEELVREYHEPTGLDLWL